MKQVYLKALCFGHYYLSFILMILMKMTWVRILCFLMTNVYLSKLETICTMLFQTRLCMTGVSSSLWQLIQPKLSKCIFSNIVSPSHISPILYGNTSLQQVFEHKHLGLILTPNLSWLKHISSVIVEANKYLTVLKKNKYILSRIF